MGKYTAEGITGWVSESQLCSGAIICQHCGHEAIKPLRIRDVAVILSLLNIPIKLDDSVPQTVIRLQNERGEVLAAIDTKEQP